MHGVLRVGFRRRRTGHPVDRPVPPRARMGRRVHGMGLLSCGFTRVWRGPSSRRSCMRPARPAPAALRCLPRSQPHIVPQIRVCRRPLPRLPTPSRPHGRRLPPPGASHVACQPVQRLLGSPHRPLRRQRRRRLVAFPDTTRSSIPSPRPSWTPRAACSLRRCRRRRPLELPASISCLDDPGPSALGEVVQRFPVQLAPYFAVALTSRQAAGPVPGLGRRRAPRRGARTRTGMADGSIALAEMRDLSRVGPGSRASRRANCGGGRNSHSDGALLIRR